MADEAAPRTVQDLLATYGWLTDKHDLAGVLELFENDATLEAPKTRTTLNGREAIGRLLSAAWDRLPANERKRRHLITGVRALATNGDEVRFAASLAVIGTTDGGESRVCNTGCYEGIAHMTERGLRFRKLVIALD